MLLAPLQRLSGQDGLYVEPRQTDGRGPDPSTTIIWLPQATFEDAQHKLRTQDRALALSRFGGKYGLRVYARDAEAIHHDLCPDIPFLAMDVHKIWELRPLPHGTPEKWTVGHAPSLGLDSQNLSNHVVLTQLVWAGLLGPQKTRRAASSPPIEEKSLSPYRRRLLITTHRHQSGHPRKHKLLCARRLHSSRNHLQDLKTNSFEKTLGFRAQILGAPFALLPSQLLPVAAEMSQ